MAEKLKLVEGDTLPSLTIVLTDSDTDEAVDLTSAVAVVKMRAAGSEVVKSTMPCTLLTGFEEEDGTVITTAPYNTPGRGGRMQMDWLADSLDTAGEYEAEVEVTFPGGKVQTVYDLLKMSVRPQF